MRAYGTRVPSWYSGSTSTELPMSASRQRKAELLAVGSTSSTLVRTREGGQRRWFYGGGVHTWKATAEETDGAFLLFEMELEQGKLTPLHTHPDSDETMYVLEGEIVVHLDGAEHRVSEGGL